MLRWGPHRALLLFWVATSYFNHLSPKRMKRRVHNAHAAPEIHPAVTRRRDMSKDLEKIAGGQWGLYREKKESPLLAIGGAAFIFGVLWWLFS
jgi:hypothetical protein